MTIMQKCPGVDVDSSIEEDKLAGVRESKCKSSAVELQIIIYKEMRNFLMLFIG